MKRLARSLTRLSASGAGSLWYLLLVVVLPSASLMLIALWSLWQSGQLLGVLITWLAITLFAYLIFVNLPQRRARRKLERVRARQDEAVEAASGATAEGDAELPEQLEERSDWSERDSAIWKRRCVAIEATLSADPAWEKLLALTVDELAAVATEYHGPKSNARYRFTLPEGLLVVSVASERYRRVIKDTVPFADRITVASLLTLYEHQAQIVGGLTWLDRTRRIARLVNPVAAAVGELRDQFTGRVLSETTSALQRDLKRVLLQEVAQVSIDLYSGRLKVSDEELAGYRSRAVRDDASRGVDAAEPLRIVLIGQVSAGKSSLVNALADTLAAEVDLLPTTDRTTVHVLSARSTDEHDAPLHIVDTPGIDDDQSRRSELMQVASDADLVIWVARATQPARAADQELHALIESYFRKHPERRRPPVMLALTHIDKLPPRNEWAPPYDLEDGAADANGTAKSKKASTIRSALESAAAAIGLADDTPAIPVSLHAPDRIYNVDTVAARILLLADDATLAQFNRRRLESGGDSGGWRARWQQTRALGTAVGKRVLKRGGGGRGRGRSDDEG